MMGCRIKGMTRRFFHWPCRPSPRPERCCRWWCSRATTRIGLAATNPHLLRDGVGAGRHVDPDAARRPTHQADRAFRCEHPEPGDGNDPVSGGGANGLQRLPRRTGSGMNCDLSARQKQRRCRCRLKSSHPAFDTFAVIYYCRIPKNQQRKSGKVMPPKIAENPAAETKAAASHQRELDAAISTITDRKSTRLNSSHLGISYAVF